MSSILYIMCTCKFWSCSIQRFRRRNIYKKKQQPTLTLTLVINRCPVPPYQIIYVPAKIEVAKSNSLRGDVFICQCIIWPLTLTTALMPWGCWKFVIVVFPDHTHLLFLKLTLRWRPHETLPSTHYVIYVDAKFEGNTPNSIGGMNFQENTLFDLWPRTWASSNGTLLSMLCIMWAMYLQNLVLLRPTL